MSVGAVSIIILATLFASIVAGTTGYGIGLTTLPVFSIILGTRFAIPIVAIVQLMSNSSRVVVNRAQVNWRCGLWFGLGAVPGALAGAWLFAHLPIQGLDYLAGGYLLCVPLIRRKFAHVFKLPERAFGFIGFFSSLVSGLIGIVGPLCAPFFLALGLTKGGFVGTEAFGSVFTHTAKLTGYAVNHAMTIRQLFIGIALAPITWLGSWIGRHIANRLKDHHFINIIDVISILFGLLMIFKRH